MVIFLMRFILKGLKENEFHPRRGELYLAALISEFNDNVQVDRFKNGGPDFKITIQEGRTFYLESTVPGDAGIQQNIDTVKKSIKTSLQKKKDQYKKWIHNKVIEKDHSFVVWIGLYGFDSIIILHWNILIDYVRKMLANSKMKDISGVILSKDCEQIAMTTGKPILFNDLRLIHNPLSTNPLPVSSLCVFQEFNNKMQIKVDSYNLCVIFEENAGQIISHKIKDWHDCYR